MDVWHRYMHHRGGAACSEPGSEAACRKVPLGTIHVLSDSCMPVAMVQATGPATRVDGRHAVGGFLASLFGAAPAAGDNSVGAAEQLAATLDSLGMAPSELNWLSALFLNASSARPPKAVFRVPARCFSSFPESEAAGLE